VIQTTNSNTGHRAAALVILLTPLIAGATPARAAGDCPSALSGQGSFIVERLNSVKTEVFYGDGPIVRTTMRSGNRTLLEATLYQGLFELNRDDRGTRIEQKPKTDLAKFFPLKPKQVISADFEVTMKGSTKPKTVKLEYVGVQDYVLGDCTYNVLKFRRNDAWPILFDNIDYYAPELKLIVAKEYREAGGRTTIIGYTGISSVKPEATGR
jgi:hypothetical protein